jgi:RNA polymerase sigma factor (sigma-70 family)
VGTRQNPLSHLRSAPGPQHLRLNVLRRKIITRRNSQTLAPPNPGRDTASPPISEEWSLIQQAIGGDLRAQKQIFTCYTAKLHRTAFAILRNREDAEDAVQEGLCKAYRKLRSFEGRSSLSTWLTRIVINSALMIRRRKNSRPEASLDEILNGQPERLLHRIVDKRPNPEQIYTTAEIYGLLEKQVRQLSPGLRASIQLCDFGGLSPADSIQVLGIHRSAFKSRISRARQKLADGLRQSLQPSSKFRLRRFGQCMTEPVA